MRASLCQRERERKRKRKRKKNGGTRDEVAKFLRREQDLGLENKENEKERK